MVCRERLCEKIEHRWNLLYVVEILQACVHENNRVHCKLSFASSVFCSPDFGDICCCLKTVLTNHTETSLLRGETCCNQQNVALCVRVV